MEKKNIILEGGGSFFGYQVDDTQTHNQCRNVFEKMLSDFSLALLGVLLLLLIILLVLLAYHFGLLSSHNEEEEEDDEVLVHYFPRTHG